MIESGLWTWAITNTALQALLGQSPQDKSTGAFNSFYFSFLPKVPTLPGIILDRIKSEEADDTIDPRTPTPGVMIEGKFQFGSAANAAPGNPANADGYLSAVLLSRTLRLQLMGLASGDSYLPDGTLIANVRIDDEFDAHFELGGQGYLYRRMLLVTIWYVESGSAAPTPQLYEGFGAPTALKANGAVYSDENTGNVYEQVFGAWQLVGNIPPGGGSELPSSTFHLVSAASTNAAVIKASAGVVTGYEIYNNTEFPLFVKLFNKATTPTPGTDVPQQTIGVDGGESAYVAPGPGSTFATGIGIAITTGIADLDATPVIANGCVVDIFYQ